MNTTRPCFLPIFILLPIYGDTRNKLINKFYNYLHTFLDKPKVFCLFLGFVCLFLGLVSLFCDLVSLFCDLVSLFFDLVSLFFDLFSLFCNLVSLFYNLVSLFYNLRTNDTLILTYRSSLFHLLCIIFSLITQHIALVHLIVLQQSLNLLHVLP